MDIEKTDLRSITRDSDKLETIVSIDGLPERPTEWLIFGEAQVRNESRLCWLSAYLDGATDFEHDSAYAVRLPLIGLQIDSVRYHNTILTAWVDPNDPADDFHVPRPGYNPMQLEDSRWCTSDYCKAEPHIIVPEGYYVPPFDRELYDAVKGKPVIIRIGPVNREV